MVLFVKGQALVFWVSRNLQEITVGLDQHQGLGTASLTNLPAESCHFPVVLKFWASDNWACASAAHAPPHRLLFPSDSAPTPPPVSVLRHGAPDPWRPRKWVGGLASARPRSRSRRWWPLGVPPDYPVWWRNPDAARVAGPRMLNVPSQAFPAPGSQQRVASQGRSKVSGDAVAYWLWDCSCCWSWPPGSGVVASLPQAAFSSLLFFTVRTGLSSSGQRDLTARQVTREDWGLQTSHPIYRHLSKSCSSMHVTAKLSQHCLF